MKTYLQIGANTISQFLGRIVSASTTILVTLLITRNLSKEVWGDFVTVTSFIALFSLIADFGLNGYVLKIFMNDKESVEKNFKDILGLRVVLSLFAIFIGLAVLAFVPHSFAVKTGVIVGMLMVLFQGLFSTAAIVFQYKLRYDLHATADILGSLIILLLVFLASLANSPLIVIVAIFVFGSFVKAVIGLFLARSLVNFNGISFDFVSFRKLIIASLPLGLMIVFAQFNNNIDKQIISLTDPKSLGVASAVAVGIYGLAYRIFDFSASLPTYIVNSSYPILLSKLKDKKYELFRFARQLLIILVAIGGVFAIVGWLLAPVGLSLFGSYSEAVLPTRILLLGLPIFFATSLLVWLVVSLNKEVVLPFIFGFAALFNLSLNLFLIPRFGYNSAAWVTILTEFIILVLLLVTLNAFFKQTNDGEMG
jgi:O-antigen/teichoic acid export membrane protein